MQKFFTTALYTLLVLALASVATLSALTLLPIKGQVQIKIVQSGSMEPTIHTGSIVVIQPATSYAVGDVVTFGADTKTQTPTTHRIVSEREEGGTQYFSTKGDANEEADTAEAPARSVIGKVLFSVPYVGYIIDFARQPLGFILLIVVPAVLIIVNEVLGIISELRGPRRKDGVRPPDGSKDAKDTVLRSVASSRAQSPRALYTEQARMVDMCRPRVFHTIPVISAGEADTGVQRYTVPALMFIAIPIALLVFQFGPTRSYYADTERSLANALSATTLDFTIDADAPRAIALSIEGEGAEQGAALVPFVASVGTSLPFSYRVEAEMTGGDATFCNALYLAGSAPPFDYDGPLLALATGTTTDKSPWNLAFYVPLDIEIADGVVCTFDLVYKGAQEGGETDEAYHDEERLSFLLTYNEAPEIQLLSVPVPETPEEPVDAVIVPEEPPALPTETEETPIEPTAETEASSTDTSSVAE